MLYLNDKLFDFDLSAALDLLSEQRREQALRFKHELGQRTAVASYILLCEGLRKEFGICEKPVFGYEEHGKPYLIGHEDIHFNISHCREAAACYISRQPVGIDIESIRPLKRALVEYTMNEEEQRIIFDSANQERAFTRLWTQKEALLKLTGQGIRDNLKNALRRNDVVLSTHETPSYIYTICQYCTSSGIDAISE